MCYWVSHRPLKPGGITYENTTKDSDFAIEYLSSRQFLSKSKGLRAPFPSRNDYGQASFEQIIAVVVSS